jgi:signal transduction histidine kinase
VDRDRFERALTNVALNGLEAMERGGALTLQARLVEGAVEISLLDTGPGIPVQLQPLVFEPFFTHGKPRGIGLGMSITRRIVEEHGGEVRLASPAGGGTCVTLRLPQPAVA